MKVSVIIPTYNCGLHINEAIQCVLSQTYNNIEIIVVDDGSTDNTTEIINQDFPSLNIIHQENGGASKARNTGISASTGELIAFLDADDLWLPSKIQKQVEIFEQNPQIGLVTTEQIYFDNTGELGKSNKADQLFRGDILKNIFWRSGLTTSSIMIRKSVLTTVGNFRTELPTAEDDNLWLRIANQSELYLINEYLTKYRVTINSLSRGINARKNIYNGVSKHIQLLIKDYPEISKHLGNLLTKRISRLHFAEGLAYLDNFEKVQARTCFINAIKLNPAKPKYYIYYMSTLMPQVCISLIKSLKRKFKSL